jgi:hypothetical protein
MEKLSDRVFLLFRIDLAFVRVRKWLTPIGRRTIFPFLVIRMRLESDLFIS